MTHNSVDKSQVGPFGLEWVDEGMPYDPIYDSLLSLREEAKRIAGKIEQIAQLPDRMFDNAMRELGLVPWYPKTDEDIAVFRPASGSVWGKHDHDSVHYHHHNADDINDHGHGNVHDNRDDHLSAREWRDTANALRSLTDSSHRWRSRRP